MKTYVRWLASCLMLLACSGLGIAYGADVQAPTETAHKPSLAEFLDVDGRLAIPKGFGGSLDPCYLSIVCKEGEAPRFVPKNRLGNGVNNSINAVAIIGTDVYVAGDFTQTSGASANRIALFNTSAKTWSALGTSTFYGVNGPVLALAIRGTHLYVGGGFDHLAGASSPSGRQIRSTSRVGGFVDIC